MADFTQQIENLAAQPKSVSVDSTSTTNQSIRDLIEADRYLKQQEAATNANPSGVTFSKLRKPGAA